MPKYAQLQTCTKRFSNKCLLLRHFTVTLHSHEIVHYCKEIIKPFPRLSRGEGFCFIGVLSGLALSAVESVEGLMSVTAASAALLARHSGQVAIEQVHAALIFTNQVQFIYDLPGKAFLFDLFGNIPL